MKPASPPAPDVQRRLLLRAGLVWAATGGVVRRAEATTVDTEPLMLEMSPEGLFITTAAVFALPRSLEDVLQHGIALYFETMATVVRPRWYWFDEQVAQARREVRLAYQPLLQRYRVSVGSLQQNYDSLDEALGVVQRTRHFRVADPAQLVPGQGYQVDAQFRLDLSQLPRPFQINVSSQADWKIDARFPPQRFVWTPSS